MLGEWICFADKRPPQDLIVQWTTAAFIHRVPNPFIVEISYNKIVAEEFQNPKNIFWRPRVQRRIKP